MANRIALNLIMKNESQVLPRLLQSLYPLIDSYAIVDTGSSDDSKAIVRAFFEQKHIPGAVHDHPFRDFSDARNHALSKLDGAAEYGFWIDCDEQLRIQPGFDIAEFKNNLHAFDAYHCTVMAGNVHYQRNCLFRIGKPFRWQGAVHETLTCDENVSVGQINGLSVQVHTDGHSWQSGMQAKYLGHARILEQAFARDNAPRDLFYLAQSYRDAGAFEQALKYYRMRVQRDDGYSEERYYSQFMTGLMLERMQRPAQEVFQEYMKASSYDALRAEHLLNALLLLQRAGQWQAALQLGKEVVERFHGRDPQPQRMLFVDGATYAWKLQQTHQHTLKVLARQ